MRATRVSGWMLIRQEKTLQMAWQSAFVSFLLFLYYLVIPSTKDTCMKISLARNSTIHPCFSPKRWFSTISVCFSVFLQLSYKQRLESQISYSGRYSVYVSHKQRHWSRDAYPIMLLMAEHNNNFSHAALGLSSECFTMWCIVAVKTVITPILFINYQSNIKPSVFMKINPTLQF